MFKKIIILIMFFTFIINGKIYAGAIFEAKGKLEYDKCSILLQKYFIINSYNDYNNESCFYINGEVGYGQDYRLIILDKTSDNAEYVDIFGFRSYNQVILELRKYKNEFIKFSAAVGPGYNPKSVYHSEIIHENDISTSHRLFSKITLLNSTEINELKYNLNHSLGILFTKLNNIPLNKQNILLLRLENKINTLISNSTNNQVIYKLNYIKLRIENKYKIINNLL